MDDELIDKIYAALIDPEPEDPELRRGLRDMIKNMIEDGTLEEMIKEARRFRDHGEVHRHRQKRPAQAY